MMKVRVKVDKPLRNFNMMRKQRGICDIPLFFGYARNNILKKGDFLCINRFG